MEIRILMSVSFWCLCENPDKPTHVPKICKNQTCRKKKQKRHKFLVEIRRNFENIFAQIHKISNETNRKIQEWKTFPWETKGNCTLTDFSFVNKHTNKMVKTQN